MLGLELGDYKIWECARLINEIIIYLHRKVYIQTSLIKLENLLAGSFEVDVGLQVFEFGYGDV